jgi:hypothetical protein
MSDAEPKISLGPCFIPQAPQPPGPRLEDEILDRQRKGLQEPLSSGVLRT